MVMQGICGGGMVFSGESLAVLVRLSMLILLFTWICFTYHFSERANSYELSEDLNEPLSPQYNCVAVSDNRTKVMIEIQHSGNVILVFDEAKLVDITLKLFEV